MQPIGAHMSIAGGVEKAVARGEEVGCTALQIFTRNASQWRAAPLTSAACTAFRSAREKSPIGPVIAHDSYLINLAAPGDELWNKSIAAFGDELERCAALGVEALVMHPGAHVGSGEAAGLERIAAALRRLFTEAPPGVTLLLENTAGQGSYLGGRFEHLATVMDRVPQGRFGVCFDTCHAFAAGYDLSTGEGYQQVMEEFGHFIGCEQIRAFHVNDSLKGCGSRVDRHAHIGEGAIGREGFAALLQDARFTTVPKILETPKGADNIWDRTNLALLRELAGE